MRTASCPASPPKPQTASTRWGSSPRREPRSGETLEAGRAPPRSVAGRRAADPRLRRELRLGAGAPTCTTPAGAPTSTSTPARASRASATTTPTCARCCRRRSPRTSSTACRSTTRRSPGCSREALSQRLPEGLDAMFFASTGAEAVDSAMKFARAATGRPRFDLLRQRLPRRHARAALAGRRRVLQGGLRSAAARLRARPVRRPRAPRGAAARSATSRRSSSSRSRAAW